MKIFFLYPSSGSQLGFNYGVAHMASILKNAGHHVDFRQLCEDLEPLPTEEQFVARIRGKSPDVLAFSVVTNQWAYTQQLASWARKVFSGPIVIGGIHTLAGAGEILRTGLFDYVFRGECEDAFLEFIEKLRQGEPLDNVANLAYCRNGQIIINPVRSLPDLPTLPPKDYESMDFQRLIDAKNGWVGLMTSRGCPFSCTYCFNHVMVSTYKHELKCSFKELNYIRRFPVEQVIDEIKYLQDHYRNITMYIFDDDIFTFEESYVEDFCRAYKKVTDIPFVVNAHVGFFDERRARALAEANCRIVPSYDKRKHCSGDKNSPRFQNAQLHLPYNRLSARDIRRRVRNNQADRQGIARPIPLDLFLPLPRNQGLPDKRRGTLYRFREDGKAKEFHGRILSRLRP
jgi:radical SAM superfamily enzyme YgiQ (UPF0313 family)